MESYKVPELIYFVRNQDSDYFGRTETRRQHEGCLWFEQCIFFDWVFDLYTKVYSVCENSYAAD